jgi:hypothetical protein
MIYPRINKALKELIYFIFLVYRKYLNSNIRFDLIKFYKYLKIL